MRGGEEKKAKMKTGERKKDQGRSNWKEQLDKGERKGSQESDQFTLKSQDALQVL